MWLGACAAGRARRRSESFVDRCAWTDQNQFSTMRGQRANKLAVHHLGLLNWWFTSPHFGRDYLTAALCAFRHFGYSCSSNGCGQLPYHAVPVRRSRSIPASEYFLTASRPAKMGRSVPIS